MPSIRQLPLAMTLLAVVSILAPSASAQAPPTEKWMLGVWEGTQSTNVRSDVANSRIEFVEEAGAITWKWHRRASGRYGGSSEAEVHGKVTAATGSTVEMKGQYVSATDVRLVGAGVGLSLSRNEDALTGHAIGRVV